MFLFTDFDIKLIILAKNANAKFKTIFHYSYRAERGV